MRKSLVVKLVLLNSALALCGCRKTCEDDNRKEQRDPNAPVTCHGTSSSGSHHGGGIWFWGGSRVGSSPVSRTTGSVTRGGFGATGHAAS